MLKIDDLHLSYTGKKTVLQGLSLEVGAGSLHGLVGLNGSGKTSLFNCLYGTVPFQHGVITWNNLPVQRRQVAYLETENYFYPRTTGMEYLNLFVHTNPAFDFQAWNQLFQLPLDRLTDDYSTGMKKKLAFLAILSFDRPVMILDEPFNGLDLETVQTIKLILARLRDNGKAVLITSHILESLTTICDAISYLTDKNIAATYSKADYHRISGAVFGAGAATAEGLVGRLLTK